MEIPHDMDAMIAPRAIKTYIDKRMNLKMTGLGLTASSVPFLFEIGNHQGVNLKDITSKLSVDKALTTRAVKQLIEKGFAEDISDSKRSCKIVLTQKGLETVKEINHFVMEVHNEIFTYISREEYQTMMIVMDKVYRRIREKEKDMN